MTWKVDDLQNLVDFLAEKGPFFAPMVDDHERLTFRQVSPGEEIELGSRTEVAARHLFQPETHFFLEFDEKPGASPVLRNYRADGRVILGLRPCDVAGIRVYESVFSESESFRRLRDGTTIIGYLCDHFEPSCFCESVGVSHRGTEDMDLFLFRAADGSYHLGSVTEKGSSLMEASPFAKDDVEEEPLPNSEQEQPVLPDDLEALLLESDELAWEKVSFACVNCRICTYVCPTCHCVTSTESM